MTKLPTRSGRPAGLPMPPQFTACSGDVGTSAMDTVHCRVMLHACTVPLVSGIGLMAI